MGILSSTAFDADKKINEDAGRALTIVHPFNSTGGVAAAVQNFKMSLADCGLNTCKMVFVDNSNSPAPTAITINGVRQVIVTPPFSQAYHHVPNGPLDLDYTVVNYGGVTAAGFNVNLTWFNTPHADGSLWQTAGPSAKQGTPFAASSSGANAILTETMPAQTGRTSYISEIAVTASGSTAGAAVNVTLTNIDGGAGAGVTLNYSFIFPVGPLVPAQPLLIEFSPPLPVLPGASAVLTVPAGGAGNTNVAASIDGFYI